MHHFVFFHREPRTPQELLLLGFAYSIGELADRVGDDDSERLSLMSRFSILQFREVAYLTALHLPCLRHFREVTGQPWSLVQLLRVLTLRGYFVAPLSHLPNAVSILFAFANPIGRHARCQGAICAALPGAAGGLEVPKVEAVVQLSVNSTG